MGLRVVALTAGGGEVSAAVAGSMWLAGVDRAPAVGDGGVLAVAVRSM